MLTEDEYLKAVGQERYLSNFGHGWVHGEWLRKNSLMFQRLECPICGRLYVGWFAARQADPPNVVPDTLFDSSFFYAFNDEPSAEDEPLTTMSAKDILQAWADAGRPGKESR
jgi:hypothetical protein